jgi:acyl-CoA reductase-like NAD-dependent aldehyde dehydrogenase
MGQQDLDLSAVKAAAIDRRGHNVFYRKRQLEKLQEAFVKEAATIQDAIVADTGCRPSEARLEFSLALRALRDRYAELNAARELELEYRIAKGTDAPDAREPYGIAIIHVSQQHTPFYSTVAPLCAALAAGNCIILQLDNTTQHSPTTLKRIIKGAVDPDSFAAASTPVQDEGVLAMSVYVSQTGDVSTRTGTTAASLIESSPSLPAVAVVDRSADMDQAAQALVRARFSFGGRSPYSPDIVFVNEFTKKDFLTALVRATIAAGDATEYCGSSQEKPKSRGVGGVDATLQRLRTGSGSGLRVITESARGVVVDVQERTPDLVTRKVAGPVLVVHSIQSLDDAIDFLSRFGVHFAVVSHTHSPRSS